MLGKVFGALVCVGFLFAVICGNTEMLGTAVLEGAASAVDLTLTLCGSMCFFCGLIEVLREAGVMRLLSRLLKPFLRFFFPEVYQNGEGAEEICGNLAANLLGAGNAATPLALQAMEKMAKYNANPHTATSGMITLAVLNTASLSLLPTTVVTLRRHAGAADPFLPVLPIWICSATSAAFALALTRLCAGVLRAKKPGFFRSSRLRNASARHGITPHD